VVVLVVLLLVGRVAVLALVPLSGGGVVPGALLGRQHPIVLWPHGILLWLRHLHHLWGAPGGAWRYLVLREVLLLVLRAFAGVRVPLLGGGVVRGAAWWGQQHSIVLQLHRGLRHRLHRLGAPGGVRHHLG